MKQPKVSVIVPVYNTEQYLHKCLYSLTHQTLQEIEIIVVNDGSTDASAAIIDDFEKQYPDKVRAFYQENAGQAKARNKALEQVSGEYIGFLDSDDFVETTMFEKMYTKAVNENADFVSCGYKDITYKNGKEVILNDCVKQNPCDDTKGLFFGAIVSPFMHLYKREILDVSGVEFPKGYIYEDTAFYINLIPYIQKPVFLDEVLANRLRRQGSTMTLAESSKVKQMLPVLEYSINFFYTRGFYQEYQKELEYFCVRILFCSSMKRVAGIQEKKERMQMIQDTIEFIQKYFPDYRRNPYFQKNVLGLYVKSMNTTIARIYISSFKITSKKKYQ